MQESSEAFATRSVEGGVGPMGPRRLRLECGQAPLVEGVDRIADGLVVAAQRAGNRGGMLPLGTGKEQLAAADGEGGCRTEPRLQGRSLVCCQRPDK